MSSSFITSSNPSEFTLPYGQYGGQQLSQVPPQYLRWMYRDWSFELKPELQRAIVGFLGLPPDPQIRLGSPAAQAFARGERQDQSADRPVGLKSGPNSGYGRAPQTGLDGFRQAFERSKREILMQFSDDQDLVELMDDVLGRVRRSLGI
jgi:putative quorum-sensing-regulated virulence factor